MAEDRVRDIAIKAMIEREEQLLKETKLAHIRSLMGSVAERRLILFELATYHDFEKLLDELPW